MKYVTKAEGYFFSFHLTFLTLSMSLLRIGIACQAMTHLRGDCSGQLFVHVWTVSDGICVCVYVFYYERRATVNNRSTNEVSPTAFSRTSSI